MVDEIGTDRLALLRRFVTQSYPDAESALLAGSWARGAGFRGSDLDIILLFRNLPGGAWRETRTFESEIIEVFAHDIGTLRYFCHEVDRPSGLPVLPTMITEGIPVLPQPAALIDEARQIASETLQLGPPYLTPEAAHARRYAITELATTLQDDRGRGVLIAVGAALHGALADFALRAAGRWSAKGKAIPRALAAIDANLATQFETAFAVMFVGGDTEPVQALVDTLLAPYGGRLRVGYRQTAPASWRL